MRQAAKRIGPDPFVANIKADVVWQSIENPHYSRDHADLHHRYVTQRVNIKESAVATMFARGHLEPHQVLAADKFRYLWEALGGSGAGAFDYSREPVDGGGSRDSISERQMDAGKQLAKARSLLGFRGYTLVSRICGEGYSLGEIGISNREKTTAADNLRTHLDDLAIDWGFKTSR